MKKAFLIIPWFIFFTFIAHAQGDTKRETFTTFPENDEVPAPENVRSGAHRSG